MMTILLSIIILNIVGHKCRNARTLLSSIYLPLFLLVKCSEFSNFGPEPARTTTRISEFFYSSVEKLRTAYSLKPVFLLSDRTHTFISIHPFVFFYSLLMDMVMGIFYPQSLNFHKKISQMIMKDALFFSAKPPTTCPP